MRINLLEIIKSLPADNFKGIGTAVGYTTIYDYLKYHYGIDNRNLIYSLLNQLNDEGLITIHRLENNNDKRDIIIAVTLP